MTATLLQGDTLASEIKAGLKKDIEQLKAKGFPPDRCGFKNRKSARAVLIGLNML